MSDSRIKNTTRNVVTSTIFRIINLAFPFVINSIIIQTLGVEYLGLNMLFASILQVLSLSELGFGTAMVFSMYKPIASGDAEKVCALLALYRKVYLIIGCIIVGGGLLCIPLLPYIIKSDVPNGLNIYILFVISLFNCVITYFMFAYRSALLEANQRKDITDKVNILIEIVLNVSKIVILITTKNYYLFCALLPLYTIINSLLVWVISRKLYPQYKCSGVITSAEKKPIFSRVIGMSINKLCFVLSNSFDSIIISSFLGLTILGQYNNYFVIANAVTMFMKILTRSATSSIGNSMVCESTKKNYDDFNTFQFIFGMILGWASICILCLNQPFINIWLGGNMLFDPLTAGIFAVFTYAILSSEVFMTYREAAGIWTHDRLRPFLEGVLNLGMNIILVQFIGVKGVMISTIITMGLIRTIWGSYYLFHEYFKEYSQRKYLLKLLHYLTFTVIAGAVSYYVCRLISAEGILGLFLRLIICSVIPLAICISVYHRTMEFKRTFKLIRAIIKKHKRG